jgi:hypothetical protein
MIIWPKNAYLVTILVRHALEQTIVLPATVLFRESLMPQQVNVNVMICFGMMVQMRHVKLVNLPVSPALISPSVFLVILLVTDCSTLQLIFSMYLVLSVSAFIVIIHLHSIETVFLVTILARFVVQERGMTV